MRIFYDYLAFRILVSSIIFDRDMTYTFLEQFILFSFSVTVSLSLPSMYEFPGVKYQTARKYNASAVLIITD